MLNEYAALVDREIRECLGLYDTKQWVDFMKKYIADWDANVARSKDAAEMRANVLKQYPGLGMEFTLNDRVATYFPAQPAANK